MLTIKEWLTAKTKEGELYEIWKTMGAFSGKDENRNILFTKKTEELAAYLSYKTEELAACLSHGNDYKSILTDIIFAIVVRAYFAHDYIFNSCPGVVVFIENHKFMIAQIAAEDPEVDAEAEFCAKMAKSITDLKI